MPDACRCASAQDYDHFRPEHGPPSNKDKASGKGDIGGADTNVVVVNVPAVLVDVAVVVHVGGVVLLVAGRTKPPVGAVRP